jgi:signal transduction histidine kinase
VTATVIDRISELLDEAWRFRESEQWERMLALAGEARVLSEQAGFGVGIPRALAVQAFVHYIRSDFRTALSECIEALQLAAGDAEAECRARSVLAMVHWSLGNYEEALKNGDRAIRLLDAVGDRVTKAFAYAVKGGILLSLGQSEEALAWHHRSLEAFDSIPDELMGRARTLSGLGLTYLAQKRYDEALVSMLEALSLARRSNHRITIARTLNDLGEVFEALGNDTQALEYHAEALEIREQDGYRQAETTSLLALGRIYARRGEHARAIEYLKRGLKTAEELEVRPRIAQFHHVLADVYQQLGQLSPALKHFIAADQVKSSLDVDQAALRYKAVVFESQLEALQRNAELESLASLGGLVGAIAHEINSPLGAIQSSANVAMLAAEKLLAGHDPKAANALKVNAQVIADASRRISELVTRLKALAGIDQARYARMEIGRAVEDVVALLAPELGDRVTVTVEKEELPAVYAYAAELYQVFLNLLRNSIQAIDGAGSVTIRASADEMWFRIAFSDTGRGIPESQLGQLFTPGFTTESGRVRASLSLFTCKTVVKKHGGDIRVESEPGRGSTFTVLLPRTLEESDPRLENGSGGSTES